MENKLTIEHLAPYLPHRLKIYHPEWDAILTMDAVGAERDSYSIDDVIEHGCKPILKPLSWFDDINRHAMSDLNTDLGIQIELSNYAAGTISLQSVPWMVMAECFRNHIDVFKLIPAGLAIEEGGGDQ